MLFTSIIFLFYFLTILLAVYYCTKLPIRNTILLIASIIFYSYGEKQFIYILLFSIICNYFFALIIDKSDYKKCTLFLSLSFNLGILFLFKYLNFTISVINSIAGSEIIRQTHARLPIGISFYTFQAISYLIDVYRKKVKANRNIIHTSLYLMFFPQLIAGPIVRYSTIEKEIKNRHENWDDFCYGVRRFIRGFGKKIILANNVSVVADYCFNHHVSCPMSWIGSICFSLQIFFDFSGYSDMAIGLGRMFGFHFEENFNFPYIAKSITDFWRRWHISLSSWFRDYVYIPLGGSKVSTKRHIFNLSVVWILTGIWHGANYTFILWGVFYLILLIVEKYVFHPERIDNGLIKIIYRIFTLLMVNFAWVVFNSKSLAASLTYYKAMFSINTYLTSVEKFYIREYYVFILIAIVLCTPIINKIYGKVNYNKVCSYALIIIKPLIYGFILFYAISYLIIGAHNPFIYFNF